MKSIPYPAIAAMLLTLAAARAWADAPGTLDGLDAAVVGLYVNATAVQPDGKTVIAGQFSSVLGVPRSNIARLNADGTLDLGFDPKTDTQVNVVALEPDGRILMGGTFTTLQPNGAATTTARNRVARINNDGSLAPDFDSKANGTVFSMARQADGKVVLGGLFTTLQPNGDMMATPRQYVARVNADGSLDTGFDPKPDGFVRCVAIQADGRILLGGDFFTLQPNGASTATARQCVARLNGDGSLDGSFDPKPNGSVSSVVAQADGKILLGGVFSTLQPNGALGATPRGNMARVNSDGTLDPDFDPKANNRVISVSLQTDGKILLGGSFTTLQPNGALNATARNHIARLYADGSVDPAFDPRAGNDVLTVALQADGEILLGGLFATLQPNGAGSATPRNLLARLNNDAATQTLSVPDATHLLWQRGGASPEVSLVTFEKSVDGGANWIALGSGVRVGTTGNWQLTGLALPGSGQVRVRGRTTNGYVNGGAGLVESTANLGPDIAVEQPMGANLTDGISSVAFGSLNVGSNGSVKTFTIRVSGTAALTGLAITKDGANPGDFTVSPPASTTLLPGNSTTFSVTFTPGATGPRTATIHITSNVVGPKNPFDVNLTGSVLSFANDQDGDGMSDAAEFQLAALGFDWQVSQPELVNAYYANANAAGLFTLSQVQALNVGVPLLQRNPATGSFTLIIGLEKSTSLGIFNPFPMTAPGTAVINGEGKLEFQFTVPDDAAFFKVQATGP